MDAENGIDENGGQLNNPEETSGGEQQIGTTIREALEKLLELEGEINKSRNEILNNILTGISSLKSTYEGRLTELEEDVKKLKEEGGEGKPAFDISPKGVPLFSMDVDTLLESDLNNEITSEKLRGEFETKNVALSENATISKEKEDLWLLTSGDEIYSIKKQEGKFLVYEKSKGVAETLDSIQKKHLEKIVKTLLGESGIEDLKEKIDTLRGTGLLDISEDKLKGITTALNYLNPATLEVIGAIGREIEGSGVEKWKEKIEELYGMGSINLEDDEFNKELKRVRLIMGIVSLLPEKDKGIPELDDVNTRLIDTLAQSKKFMSDMYTRLLHYEGVMLLKTGAFKNAYECFNKITNINPSRKGAWLNRGVAAGKFGDIDNEIESYKKALNVDPDYDKALKNMKIAKIKKSVIMKMQCIIKLLRKEKSKEPIKVNVK